MASITFNIPDDKLIEFKLGFLKRHPVPIDIEGNPAMTDNQWIKEWGKQRYFRAYQTGKKQLAYDNELTDSTIVE